MTLMPAELLRRYVILHNLGVETGDFEPLMRLFESDAILAFENPRIGEFEGIEMIRGVFRRQPPVMTIAIGEIAELENNARADYMLDEEPGHRKGYISIDSKDDKILKLFIGL
jgi:hypothetical protein